jgi:putative isomerase
MHFNMDFLTSELVRKTLLSLPAEDKPVVAYRVSLKLKILKTFETLGWRPTGEFRNLLEISDVGLNALYVADCQALEEIARILGREDDRQELSGREGKYAAALATLWDEKSGIYLNRRTDTGEPSPRLSPTNFYPLIAKAPTQEQARRMIQEHYFNPREFYGEWVMPSIARNVPGYGDQNYWRGRIWGPMNFLVYLGLRNYDLKDARADLVERSARLLMKSWQSDRAIYENYNANTGAGNDVRSSDAYYHWGALLGVIDLLDHGR